MMDMFPGYIASSVRRRVVSMPYSSCVSGETCCPALPACRLIHWHLLLCTYRA